MTALVDDAVAVRADPGRGARARRAAGRLLRHVTAALGEREQAIRTLTRSARSRPRPSPPATRSCARRSTSCRRSSPGARDLDRLGDLLRRRDAGAWRDLRARDGRARAGRSRSSGRPRRRAGARSRASSASRDAGTPTFRALPASPTPSRAFVPLLRGLPAPAQPARRLPRPVLPRDLDLVRARRRRRRQQGQRSATSPACCCRSRASSLPGTLPPRGRGRSSRTLSGGLDTRGSNAYPAPGAAADPSFNGDPPPRARPALLPGRATAEDCLRRSATCSSVRRPSVTPPGQQLLGLAHAVAHRVLVHAERRRGRHVRAASTATRAAPRGSATGAGRCPPARRAPRAGSACARAGSASSSASRRTSR